MCELPSQRIVLPGAGNILDFLAVLVHSFGHGSYHADLAFCCADACSMGHC